MSRYGVERYGITRYSKADKQLNCDYIPNFFESDIYEPIPVVSTLEVSPDVKNSKELSPMIVNTKEV